MLSDLAGVAYGMTKETYLSSAAWTAYSGEEAAPTNQPTPRPTKEPTAPTNQPTPRPTKFPTTKRPTASPTPQPTGGAGCAGFPAYAKKGFRTWEGSFKTFVLCQSTLTWEDALKDLKKNKNLDTTSGMEMKDLAKVAAKENNKGYYLGSQAWIDYLNANGGL